MNQKRILRSLVNTVKSINKRENWKAMKKIVSQSQNLVNIVSKLLNMRTMRSI